MQVNQTAMSLTITLHTYKLLPPCLVCNIYTITLREINHFIVAQQVVQHIGCALCSCASDMCRHGVEYSSCWWRYVVAIALYQKRRLRLHATFISKLDQTVLYFPVFLKFNWAKQFGVVSCLECMRILGIQVIVSTYLLCDKQKYSV